MRTPDPSVFSIAGSPVVGPLLILRHIWKDPTIYCEMAEHFKQHAEFLVLQSTHGQDPRAYTKKYCCDGQKLVDTLSLST